MGDNDVMRSESHHYLLQASSIDRIASFIGCGPLKSNSGNNQRERDTRID